MIVSCAYIHSSTPPTDFARRYDGTNYDYIANPANQYDAVGAMSFWFRVPVLLSANGYIPIICFSHNGSPSGAYGKKMQLCVRRRSAGYGNTNNYFDWEYVANGTNSTVKSSNLVLAANTWYHVSVCSDGSIYINGTLATYIYWITAFTSGWFSGITGTNHDLSFGAILTNTGAFGIGGRVDLDDYIYFNDNLTSGEVTEIYGTGTRPPDPASFTSTLQAKIVTYRNWENTLAPVIGSGTLTPIGSPSYIAFP